MSAALEERKKKEKAVSEALDYAEKNYQHIQGELSKYKSELEQAIQKLEELRSSGTASEEAMKEQEAAVARLTKGIEEGEVAFIKAGGGVDDWKAKLNIAQTDTLKANSALETNTKYLNEAQKSTEGCAKSIDGYGKQVKTIVEYTRDANEIIKET